MPRLTRAEVRRRVDTEEVFSRKWEENRPNYQLPDSGKSIAEWLTFMDVYLQAAKKAVTLAKPDVALQNIRCLINLGEACAQHHEMPPRAEGDDTDLYE